jgi:NHL repeat
MRATRKLFHHRKTLGSIAACCCLAGMLFSAAPALALEGYEPATPASFGEPGPGAGQLEAPEGVAVNDATGDVYVADVGNARIDEFEADGKFVRAWGWGVATGTGALETCTTTCRRGLIGTGPGQFTTPAFVAVDNTTGASKGDVYVSDSGDHTITKFTEDGALVSSWATNGQLTESAPGEPLSETQTRGIAVDATANLWLYNEGQVLVFDETGALIPADTLNAGFNARTTGSLAVTSGDEAYIVHGVLGRAAKLSAGSEPLALESESGEELGAKAVAVNPVSQDVLLDQETQIGLYAPITTQRPKPLQVFAGEELSESHGIAASATALYATQRVADNVEAFTFGALKPQIRQTSVSEVGSTTATFHGQVLPQGEPTSYFFEYGTTTAYGKHTPTEPAGAGTAAVGVAATVEGLSPDTVYHFRLVAVNANGEREGPDVSFTTFPQGILGLPDGRGFELVSQLEGADGEVVKGVRAAAEGSAVAYLGQAPAEGGNGNSGNNGEVGIKANSGDNAYLARRGAGGWSPVDLQPPGLVSVEQFAFSADLSTATLTSAEPLLEGAPAERTLYSRDNTSGSYRVLAAGAAYQGSTPDGAHVLYSTGAAGLFESTAGSPAAVNVLPEGGSAAHAVFGAPARLKSNTLEWGLGGPDLSSVVSSDGSRVFWTETDATGAPLRLFVTEHAGSAAPLTRQLDTSAGHTGGGGRFETASADGSRVFFTDCNQLTADSTAVHTRGCQNVEERGHGFFTQPSGNDLYEADLATGTLTDLSVDHAQNANLMGVLGASADGSYVYFAAAGALAPGAVPQECFREVDGGAGSKCNVYLVHDGGAPQFVAALNNQEWGEWSAVLGARSAVVASSSGELVFTSALNLTSFDAHHQNEIYSYIPGAGVSCLSCNPSGALTPPGSGAVLPESQSTTFALRDVSADGSRVFFQTAESLVPSDQNGKIDVYESERDGAGSCTRPAGCLFVISGGSSTYNSFFVDASESGDDVFFISRADLVPADKTDRTELYDARVGATQPLAQPVCSGTGCQGVPAAPPIFSTPPSVTITGVDDFPPAASKVIKKKTVKCAKGKTLKRGKCTKIKNKKKKAKKPSNNRRGK